MVGWLWVVLLSSVTWAAPAVGLVLIVLGRGTDGASTWLDWALYAFGAACVVQAVMMFLWFETKGTRHAIQVASGVVAVVCSAVAAVLLMSTTEARSGWLDILVLATGGLGVVVLLLFAFGRREGRAKSRKPPRRGPRNGTTRARYKATRAEVLDILIARKVVAVDDADRIRLLEFPLGYWEELDGVDEAERRRILELRLVGWRGFDASDERAWPPEDHAS